MKRPRVWLAWSSGKDSAWALYMLRMEGIEVVGLLTTLNEAVGRVAMHEVRRELLEAQADAAGLPLQTISLPWPCSNAEYEHRMRRAIEHANADHVTHFAFGDLFLQDIRDYRVRQLAGTGIEPLFPLWCSPLDTPALAREMITQGLRAVLTCVDARQLAASFAGRSFDVAFLRELPAGVDPCGERGEFHTFAFAGPMFSNAIEFELGEISERDGFCYADLCPLPVSV